MEYVLFKKYMDGFIIVRTRNHRQVLIFLS